MISSLYYEEQSFLFQSLSDDMVGNVSEDFYEEIDVFSPAQEKKVEPAKQPKSSNTYTIYSGGIHIVSIPLVQQVLSSKTKLHIENNYRKLFTSNPAKSIQTCDIFTYRLIVSAFEFVFRFTIRLTSSLQDMFNSGVKHLNKQVAMFI